MTLTQDLWFYFREIWPSQILHNCNLVAMHYYFHHFMKIFIMHLNSLFSYFLIHKTWICNNSYEFGILQSIFRGKVLEFVISLVYLKIAFGIIYISAYFYINNSLYLQIDLWICIVSRKWGVTSFEPVYFFCFLSQCVFYRPGWPWACILGQWRIMTCVLPVYRFNMSRLVICNILAHN